MGLLTIEFAPMELIRSGEYAAAIAQLGSRWPGIGVTPPQKKLSDRDYALLLLACGTLSVKLGKIEQSDCLESSKDMLSESARLLEGQPEECAARLYLGTAYSDCGEYQEALTVAENVLSMEADSEIEFNAGVLKAIAQKHLGPPLEALQTLEAIKPLTKVVAPIARGKYYLERGNLKHLLGQIDEAITEYDIAEQCFLDCGSTRHAAMVSNNLSGIYLDQECLPLAHSAAQRAINLFHRLRDKAFEAKAWDQLARIYLSQGNYFDAEDAARRSVGLLSKGNNQSWLAESLITHGRALAKMGIEQAERQLSKAADLCRVIGDRKQGLEAGDELAKLFNDVRTASRNLRQSIDSVEHTIIKRALECNDQRISPAAQALGIKRQLLEKKISKFSDLTPKKRTRRKTLVRNQ